MDSSPAATSRPSKARPSRLRTVLWCLSFGVLMSLALRLGPAWSRPWVAVAGCLVLALSWRAVNRPPRIR